MNVALGNVGEKQPVEVVVTELQKSGNITDLAGAMKAGEVSIHSCLLLHGSDANRSDRRRCGIGIRYATIDVRADATLQAKGILCRGTDPDGNWADPPRPTFEP